MSYRKTVDPDERGRGRDKGETVIRMFYVREGIYFPTIGNSYKLNQIKRKR